MKTFRHALGDVAGQTMTVAELRAKLSEYPDDMPVFGEWEGVHGYITPELMSVETVCKGHKDDECECLLIWVEDYY
jgi:hypothetical protein